MAVSGWQLKNRVTCVHEKMHELGYYRVLGVDDESMIEKFRRNAQDGQWQENDML